VCTAGATVACSAAGTTDAWWPGRSTRRTSSIRCSFDVRGAWLARFPETFSVPTRFAKHMMIVADLDGGDAGAIEDALIAAWQLQSGSADG
jgi:hypothetical protein